MLNFITTIVLTLVIMCPKCLFYSNDKLMIVRPALDAVSEGTEGNSLYPANQCGAFGPFLSMTLHVYMYKYWARISLRLGSSVIFGASMLCAHNFSAMKWTKVPQLHYCTSIQRKSINQIYRRVSGVFPLHHIQHCLSVFASPCSRTTRIFCNRVTAKIDSQSASSVWLHTQPTHSWRGLSCQSWAFPKEKGHTHVCK